MSKTLREFVDQLDREEKRSEVSRSGDNQPASSMDQRLSTLRTQQILDRKKKLMKKPGLKSES